MKLPKDYEACSDRYLSAEERKRFQPMKHAGPGVALRIAQDLAAARVYLSNVQKRK